MIKKNNINSSNDELVIDIKEGYQYLSKGAFSINTITIKPKEHFISFEESLLNSYGRLPLSVIKENASKELANKIIDNLVYKKQQMYNNTVFHTFSIKDYSIRESQEKQQRIDNLLEIIDNLNKRVTGLFIRNFELEDIIKYNSRSIFQKIKDYILYRSKFNKSLADLIIEEER